MAEFEIGELMRLGHVRRWHIVRVKREQTVAEHTALVCLIAQEIVRRLHLDARDAMWQLSLLEWALYHDTPEIVTGDIPTPTKKYIQQKAGDDGFMVMDPLDDLERKASKRWNELERWSKITDNGLPGSIVKMADLTESIRFLTIERVDRHGEHVLYGLRHAYQIELLAARGLWSNLPWQHLDNFLSDVLYEATAKGWNQ